VRRTIAFLSLGIVPATWWLARVHVGRGWRASPTRCPTSVLDLQFAQQARPHAPPRRPSRRFALLAGFDARARTWGPTQSPEIAAALAIASFRAAVSVLFALAAAHCFRDHDSVALELLRAAPRRALAPIVARDPDLLSVLVRAHGFGRPSERRDRARQAAPGSHTLSLSSFVGSGILDRRANAVFYELCSPSSVALGVLVIVARLGVEGLDHANELAARARRCARLVDRVLAGPRRLPRNGRTFRAPARAPRGDRSDRRLSLERRATARSAFCRDRQCRARARRLPVDPRRARATSPVGPTR